ncbi:hypothetical protein LrDSM24759_04060 [Lactobacillus rodentium]|uniref:Uncharacterized protein n=2 Tax=Lactobacillus rodentium TaxID=947835 RepID=A0A2Z6TEP9_9LACO|nr:hypothetical protein LrDSM24759_04060 [Lactobacillus rodentium]
MSRKNENKKSKKTIKYVFLGLLIGVVTLIGIWQLLAFQTRIQQQQQRERIALWCVQHFSGKKPIRNIKVGRIRINGIGGSAGKSTSVIINNKDVNRLEGMGLNDDGEPDGSFIYNDQIEYTYHSKKNTCATLRGVKVEEWRNN